MSGSNMPDLLTTNQVQALLQVDRTTIYRLVEGGKLPAIRVGKQWRFSKSDVERWLQTQTITSSQDPGAEKSTANPGIRSDSLTPLMAGQISSTTPALRELLPQACVQLIQDEFAELLGVMMVITDMQGEAVTSVSNPCGYYTALVQEPGNASQCIRDWQRLAASPAMHPTFMPNEMGFMCARGLIRVHSELKGMVVIGGIAPEVWPPGDEFISRLAVSFGVSTSHILANAESVYRLDKPAQVKALRAVQRIADIYSHIAGDRNALWDRMQTIASLTAL
jgi:excisionase family DNA binding protein